MNVRAVKTAESQLAVNRITQKINKNFDFGVSFEIPQEFAEKRKYMQSDEFIKDSHNKRMFDIIDDVMLFRDRIAKEIADINNVIRDKMAQAVNGYARVKDDLDKDYSLNFDDNETLHTPAQIQYRLLKNVLLFRQSLCAKEK